MYELVLARSGSCMAAALKDRTTAWRRLLVNGGLLLVMWMSKGKGKQAAQILLIHELKASVMQPACALRGMVRATVNVGSAASEECRSQEPQPDV